MCLSLFLRAGGELSDGMDIGYVDSLAINPHFLFVLPKRKRAVDGPKEKTLGANLHVRASLLKTRVFRICADWNRESSAGSRRAPPSRGSGSRV